MNYNLEKSPKDSVVITRKLVMPHEINPNGTLFGGVLLSWIDQTAYMTAQIHSGRPFVVTVSMDQIVFHKPIFVGDHVILKSRITMVGRSSMEIFVAVDREDGSDST
jgi:acyl-CoA hydrolase